MFFQKIIVHASEISYFDQILTKYWNRKRWKIEDLRTICNALSENLPAINPNLFIHDKLAYIEHLKNWLS